MECQKSISSALTNLIQTLIKYNQPFNCEMIQKRSVETKHLFCDIYIETRGSRHEQNEEDDEESKSVEEETWRGRTN